jgi:hypothetical protein
MWTLSYGEHEDRTPTRGYEATREAAMQAFARSYDDGGHYLIRKQASSLSIALWMTLDRMSLIFRTVGACFGGSHS